MLQLIYKVQKKKSVVIYPEYIAFSAFKTNTVHWLADSSNIHLIHTVYVWDENTMQNLREIVRV